MTRGIYPFFQPPVAEIRFLHDGKAVFAHLPILDDLAKAEGLTPLSAFMDPSKLSEEQRGALEDANPGPSRAAWDAWFEVEDGRRAIEALLNRLWREERLRHMLDSPQQVLEELEYLAACLRMGKLRSSRFRLELY